MSEDPVHYHESGSGQEHDWQKWDRSGWYFWDETWANRYGPFVNEDVARAQLADYCQNELAEAFKDHLRHDY